MPVTGLIQLEDVAVDMLGNVYVVDGQGQTVYKETPSGGIYTQTTVGTGLEYPMGVAVDANGSVYIFDYDLGEILKESWDVRTRRYVQTTVPTTNFTVGQIDSGLAVDLSGNVYFATNAAPGNGFGYGLIVEEALSQGVYTQVIVAQNLNYPDAVAVDASGNVYFNDDGAGTIYKAVPSAGSFTVTAIDQDLDLNQMNFLDGIAVDASGNIDFTDFLEGDDTTNHILQISPSAANFGGTGTTFTNSSTIQALFGVNAGTTIDSIAATTLGATGLDFATVGTAGNFNGLCPTGASYSTSYVCSVDISFTPSVAGTRYGAVQLMAAGAPLATGYVVGTGLGPQLTFLPGSQSTVGFGLLAPEGVAVDGAGNVYIASSGNGAMLMDTLSGGTYSQEQIGTNFFAPGAVAVDGAGNIYVADFGGNAVYKDTPVGTLHFQTTVASGLNAPTGVAVDANGNVYIVNSGTQQVFKETFSNGVYTQSVIGSGFIAPYGVAVDGNGNVYVSDTSSSSVFVETLAGTSYTQSTLSGGSFENPEGLAVDGVGDVYVADVELKEVLKETATASSSYIQSVVPASGLTGPSAVAVDGSGNVYIADSLGSIVFKETFANLPSLSFAPTTVGTTSADSPKAVMLQNIGNSTLYFWLPDSGNNPTVLGDFVYDSGAPGTCPVTSPTNPLQGTVAASSECLLPVSFTPMTAGALTGSLLITDNNLNAGAPSYSTQSIQLLGTGTSLPTIASFVASPSTITAGSSSTLTGVFSNGTGVITPGNISVTSGTGVSVSPTATTTYTLTVTPTTGTAVTQTATVTVQAAKPVPAAPTSPTPGSTFKSNHVAFTWTAGVGAAMYDLYLGTTGVGSNSLYQTGHTTALSATATIPTNGAKVYTRLLSYINGAWQYNDYTFTEGSMAVLTTPVQGSTLTGASVTFDWTPGANVTVYDLYVGSTGVGPNNVYQTGHITATSTTAINLPTTGATLYVRLLSLINGSWQYLDYTFTEAMPAGTPAALTSPANGATLGSSNVTFSWTSGTNVTEYDLYLGTTVGSNNRYQTGHITAMTTTVPKLPSTGATVYARLLSLINGTWQHNDYTFIEP